MLQVLFKLLACIKPYVNDCSYNKAYYCDHFMQVAIQYIIDKINTHIKDMAK